jgi:hypothetical protein
MIPTTQETPKKNGMIPAAEQAREAMANPFVCLGAANEPAAGA